jgi:hypothetical protein
MEVQRRFREAVQHRAEVIVQVQGRCKVQGARCRGVAEEWSEQ